MIPAEDLYLQGDNGEENVINTCLLFHIEILRGESRLPVSADSKIYNLHAAYIQSTGRDAYRGV